MRLHNSILIFAGCVLAAFFSGCASNEVQITEGTREPTNSKPVISHNEAHLVHIDLFARIATVRNGAALAGDFLIATNYAGVETAVLKVRPSTSLTLITADILEGDPKINNRVNPADSARSLELSKLYSISE